MTDGLEIVGARTNNLKSVDVVLPLRKATMLVGVSGSGKSSLLADTLATETNSRMRRFLRVSQPHLDDSDVPAFLGPLPPGIHFAQSAFRASQRTTVGTSTGIVALLRRYFSRYSEPWAEEAESLAPRPSPLSYAAWIERHYTGCLIVWTVVERWKRSDGTNAIARLRKHGLKVATLSNETDSPVRRARGREVDLAKFRPLAAHARHLIEARIGRTRVSGRCPDLIPLLQRAFDIGGDVIVEFENPKDLPRQLQTEHGMQLDSALHCVHPEVLQPFFSPSDALLSFNSPSSSRSGACAVCQGLGTTRSVLLNALAARPHRSMNDGAFTLWTEKNYRYVNIQHETIEGLRGLRGFSPDIPWERLSSDAQRLVLFGSGAEVVTDIDRQTGRKTSVPRPFPGFVPAILRRAEGRASASRLAGLLTDGPCSECAATRWSREARALRLGHWRVHELLRLSFDDLRELSKPGGSLEQTLVGSSRPFAKGLHVAASAFVAAGLGHLSPARGMTTLSEGESRRSRLAALLRTRGEGLVLMLDEPARGLHEEDVARLSTALASLKRRHTLIINEHRVSLARFVDRVLEIGPGAGDGGGRIVAQGTPQRMLAKTSQNIEHRRHLPVASTNIRLTVSGARIHTLSDLTCDIPLGRLVSITGVSGSGKSSFVRGILVPALARELPDRVDSVGFAWDGGSWDSVEGVSRISSVLALQPRTPSSHRRSAVATLLGLADDLRAVFARCPEASTLGLSATDFGWNAGRGRCRTCLGLGEIEDHSGWVTCPHCGGRRFGQAVISVRLDGDSVADVLELPIADLLTHSITDEVGCRPLLDQLVALDLGYLTLGRRLDRLSGGEHQRLRIAQTLANRHSEGLLLVLDEPSAGLHPRDVARLLRALDRVVAHGANTVLLVEHNLDLIRASDWVIDFGPGGGPDGGRVVGLGPPAEIAAADTATGRALAGRQPPAAPLDIPVLRQESTSRHVEPHISAQNARHWLKRLIGQDVPTDALDPIDFDDLAVVFDEVAAVARPYEIGGLDVEIARLLLDRQDDFADELAPLADTWARRPDSHLQIQPLLEEFRVWGARLPTSVTRTVRHRLRDMGLESPLNESLPPDLTLVRATGTRFRPLRATSRERIRKVRDALALGAGYVELVDGRHRVLAITQTRHLNLESQCPAVAPLSPGSPSLSRFHAAGWCPCCAGTGSVQTLDEDLFVARPAVDPLADGFLRAEALAVFRGVRRNTLLPFFKRMIAEGLWSPGRPFSRLSPEERSVLMHGFWCRPGHGSFLKNPRAKPDDVRSWLRWDGLVRAILLESQRSRQPQWRELLSSSTLSVECPRCTGTGLQPHSRAIRLGRRSWFDWVRAGTVEEFATALRHANLPSRRAERMKQRILYCLAPLLRTVPRASLRQPIQDPALLRPVFERAVDSMTQLRVLN